MEGSTNFADAVLDEENADMWGHVRDVEGGRSATPNSHSDIIRTAVDAITANQENVFTGILDVVWDHHRQKLRQETKLLYTVYLVVVLIGLSIGIGCFMLYSTQAGLILFIVFGCLTGLMFLLVFPILLYGIFGKSPRIINWRLRNAARYINVCQVSEEYANAMLPNFSPEVQEVCHCQLAGSSGDSFGFFPSFSANVGCCKVISCNAVYPPFTQDVDMNLFYDALVLTEQNLVDIGQPGFCWVQINQLGLLSGSGESFIQDCLVQHPQIPGKLYLSGKLVSEKIGSYIPTDRMNVSYNYPAVTYKTEIKGPQGRFNFDVDVVFGIKLSLWPQEARAWSDRVQGILPGDIIQAVQSLGCYIVHKHCSGSELSLEHQNHDLDWRITFAEAESLLFKHHASKEALKLCYVIIKFFMKICTNTSKKHLPALKSYYLKTVFLWFAEEGHATYDLVEKKNNNFANLFLLLFEKYQDVLEKGQLPHYFMPSVNILASCSKEELAAGVEVIKGLRRRPIATIESFDLAWISSTKYTIMIITFYILMIIAKILPPIVQNYTDSHN